MSWTSPLTVASTIVPLPASSAFSMCGSRWATAAFITSADCSTKGSCICPEPNSSPTVFMPASRCVVDDRQRRASPQRFVEVVGQALLLAVDDPTLEPLEQRQRQQLLRLGRTGRVGCTPSNTSRKCCSGSWVTFPESSYVAPVPDEVQRGLALLVGDPVHRQDLRRVHDGGVQPRLLASCRNTELSTTRAAGRQTEGDVRQAQRGLHLGVAALELPDRLDRLDARRGGSPPGRWRSGT